MEPAPQCLEGSIYIAAGSLKPGSGGVTGQLIVFTMP